MRSGQHTQTHANTETQTQTQTHTHTKRHTHRPSGRVLGLRSRFQLFCADFALPHTHVQPAITSLVEWLPIAACVRMCARVCARVCPCECASVCMFMTLCLSPCSPCAFVVVNENILSIRDRHEHINSLRVRSPSILFVQQRQQLGREGGWCSDYQKMRARVYANVGE